MKRSTLGAVVVALVLAAGCSSLETSLTDPDDNPPIFDVFVEIPSEQVGSAAVSPAIEVSDDQGNILTITEASLVVREMELGRGSGECEDLGDSDQDDDACAELTSDPRLLELPATQGQAQLSRLQVSAGSYDRLEFELRQATEDADFLDTNPQIVGESVVVSGDFNDTSFTVRLDPQADLTVGFPEPVQAQAGGLSQVTLVIDMGAWFRAEDGSLIDPSEAAGTGELESRVESQLTNSFSIELGAPGS